MTTYNSYEAAKIANPDKEVITRRSNEFKALDCKFNVGWRSCNPADYCMTVEKFLVDGNKFTKGDLHICSEGYVHPVLFVDSDYNKPSNCDNNYYILRAAALEEKKPRTKVEYVKCEFDSAWEAVKAFEDGEKLYTKRSHKDYILIDNAPDVLRFLYDLHERIETPMTEREEFIEVLQELWIIDGVDGQEQMDKIFDSGKFKIVNHDSDFLRSRIRAVSEWEMNTSNNHDWESVAESIYCAVDDLLKS